MSKGREKMRTAILIIAALLTAPLCAMAADSVQPAVPVDRQPPAYPDSAGNAEGTVRLSFKIDADGHVHGASVIDSNPKGVFDSAALAAVGNWIYRPRTVNGKAMEQPDNTILLRFKPAAPTDERAIVFSPAPYYPEAAYLAKAEGKVWVEFDVTADGDTTNVRAVEATVPGLFDAVAVSKVKETKFEPLPDPNAPPIHLRRAVVFTMAEARLKARPDKIKPPPYPMEAQNIGIGGTCDINFNIRTDGTVKDPKVAMCYPKGLFDQASLEAIRTWTFHPVTGPNGPEESPALYRFSFKIDGVSERDRHYLRPHQWIRLKYTLTEKGTATDVEVVGTSEPGLPTHQAVEQLRYTQLAPIVVNGNPVRTPGREVRIVGQ
jgi:TonB family protein